jgi:hypothetical protein
LVSKIVITYSVLPAGVHSIKINSGYELFSTVHKKKIVGMDVERPPISGIDYPGPFQEYYEWFSSDHVKRLGLTKATP